MSDMPDVIYAHIEKVWQESQHYGGVEYVRKATPDQRAKALAQFNHYDCCEFDEDVKETIRQALSQDAV